MTIPTTFTGIVLAMLSNSRLVRRRKPVSVSNMWWRWSRAMQKRAKSVA